MHRSHSCATSLFACLSAASLLASASARPVAIGSVYSSSSSTTHDASLPRHVLDSGVDVGRWALAQSGRRIQQGGFVGTVLDVVTVDPEEPVDDYATDPPAVDPDVTTTGPIADSPNAPAASSPAAPAAAAPAAQTTPATASAPDDTATPAAATTPAAEPVAEAPVATPAPTTAATPAAVPDTATPAAAPAEPDAAEPQPDTPAEAPALPTAPTPAAAPVLPTPEPSPAAAPAATPTAAPAPAPSVSPVAEPADVPSETPAPTTAISPVPEEQPVPAPVEPAEVPSPTLAPAPAPAPDPVALPAPAPAPDLGPITILDPAPLPVPDPAPIPAPDLAPLPSPEPVSIPTPDAAPAPDPVPLPEPEPLPAPEPEVSPPPPPEEPPAAAPEPEEGTETPPDDSETEEGSSSRVDSSTEDEGGDDDDGPSTGVIIAAVGAVVVAIVACVLCVCCCNSGNCGSTRPKAPPPIARTPGHSGPLGHAGGPPPASPAAAAGAYAANGAVAGGGAAAAAAAADARRQRSRRHGSGGSPDFPADPRQYPSKALISPTRPQPNQNVNIYDDSAAFAPELAGVSPQAYSLSPAYKSPTARHASPAYPSPPARSPGAQASLERFDSLAEAAAPALAAASARVKHRRTPSQSSPGHHHRGSLTPARVSAADSLYATDQHSVESGASHRGSHIQSPSFVSLYMMPDGHSANRVTEAYEFLTQHAADRVTVVAEDARAAGPHTLVETLTGTEAAEAMPETPMQVLEKQLDWIESAGGVLIEKYQLEGALQRRRGGQGMVAFVSDRASETKYAVKFYFGPNAFRREQAAITAPELAHAMPACVDIIDDPALRRLPPQNGVPPPQHGMLPPMIITERGECLREYVSRKHPDFVSCLQIIVHIAEKLQIMHMAGFAHRDLKPGNCIWLPSQNTWSLIDFGCTAPCGSKVPVSFTLKYAAPETVQAFTRGRDAVVADTAVDVFAFGIMCYELLTRRQYYPKDCSGQDVGEMLAGSRRLPHESMDDATARRLGVLRSIVLKMLERSPDMRTSISDLLRTCSRMFQTGEQTIDV